MNLGWISLVLLAAVTLEAGCKSQEPARSVSPTAPASITSAAESADAIVRIHWLGKKKVVADTNAVVLNKVLNLPESAKLEKQTLDKLSLAPWPLLGRPADKNASALLRPLIDDVLQEESYLEVRQPTNRPVELLLAVRLTDARAAMWETNLAAVLESLTGIHPVPAAGNRRGWSLRKHHVPNLLELTRANGWTLIGASQEHNELLTEVVDRLEHTRLPFTASTGYRWLTAAVDFTGAARAFSIASNLPGNFPRISLDAVGDGTNVLTCGVLTFSRPLPMQLQPWNVPTNLIDEHLVSFMAVRGIQSWLASLKAWNNLQVGPPPDQWYFWAVQGLQMESYFAAPLPDASNVVCQLTDKIMQRNDAWSATNTLAEFKRSQSFNGLAWRGLGYMAPFLQSTNLNNTGFVHGGGFANIVMNPLSAELVQKILGRDGLVYHDWELTGARTEQWLYMGQFARYVSLKAQLPFGSASVLWLKAVAHKLGPSVTDIVVTGPNQLSFRRESTVGCTAVELQLLADWLESPRFPIGLHTFEAPPDPRPIQAPSESK